MLDDRLARFGPNVIGGSNGSGTRLLARIVRHGGMFIGTNLHPKSEDSKDFLRFGKRWTPEYKAAQTTPLSVTVLPEMVQDFEQFMKIHTAPLHSQPQPWGWKAPRAVVLLPFLHAQLPTLKFLHLVRDGRDMAFAYETHPKWNVQDTETYPRKAITLWRNVNLAAADYGEQQLGRRYLRVRFEDVCLNPEPHIAAILAFFDLTGDPKAIARLEVHPPESIGRWRQRDELMRTDLERIGREALERFGYLANTTMDVAT